MNAADTRSVVLANLTEAAQKLDTARALLHDCCKHASPLEMLLLLELLPDVADVKLRTSMMAKALIDTEAPSDNECLTRRFKVEGTEFSYAEMRFANRDDEALCAWLRAAAIGDIYPDGARCERVA